jgi:hypothetical protein
MHRTIWDLMTDDASPASKAKLAPYSSKGSADHYSLYSNTTRGSRQRDHAINHCFEMTDYCYRNGHVAQGSDWIIAAGVHAGASADLTDRLFALWATLATRGAENWVELLREPPAQLGKRLTAVTLLRLLATDMSPKNEVRGRMLEFICSAVPDVCGHIGLRSDLPDYQQIDCARQLDPRIAELLNPVTDASQVKDLDSILLRHHSILRSLNHNLVSAVLALHAPNGFAKTTVPAILKSVEELAGSQDTRFVEVATRTQNEISSAEAKLIDCGTFYALTYLYPFVRHVKRLVQERFESSDATKPASVNITPYPRKYPFHAAGQSCRLRFQVVNSGPGPATDLDVLFTFYADVEPIEVQRSISELEAGQCLVDVDVQVGQITEPFDFEISWSWSNYDSSRLSKSSTGQLSAQNPNVDWGKLLVSEPYSMEAIPPDSSRLFIGREADLQRLYRAVASQAMGSAYVYGQKRVGKTSLARAAGRKAKELLPQLVPIYLEGGDYVQPTAQATLQAMGRMIVRRISRSARALERIPQPDFKDSLAPLNEYVDEVLDIVPESRFLLILDEFDELPLELYKRGPIGDGFFLTLRALSGRERIGIILVGAEKMAPIIAAQGDQLNRFEPVHLDYFRKDEHWSDFQDLVRRPVADALEYSDSAIDSIYRWSAGNPFFTNMVCREILTQCYDRRDAFVTDLEVEECASRACQRAGANSFQHFWEDGILNTGANVEEVSIQRRRVLLALAAILRSSQVASRDALATQRDVMSLSQADLDRELKQFVERGVLIEDRDEYRCRVFMFEEFLRERSAQMITTEFTDQDERTRREREENEAYVTSGELQTVVERWGIYLGSQITVETVRSWLEQFASNQDRRLMFQLLKAIRFYSEPQVREKLRGAMGAVRRMTLETRREGERHRSDLLVTHLGGIAKSGTQYARLFCTENKIIARNAIGLDALASSLQKQDEGIQAIVAIDDILGSGDSAVDALKAINQQVGDAIRSSGKKVILIFVCGFEVAVDKVRKQASYLKLPIEVYVCDKMDDRDRAFSTTSTIFANDRDRHRALEITRQKGEELERQAPLGYADGQGLVVFFGNCPNNTLPILRKNGKEWRALFPRV